MLHHLNFLFKYSCCTTILEFKGIDFSIPCLLFRGQFVLYKRKKKKKSIFQLLTQSALSAYSSSKPKLRKCRETPLNICCQLTYRCHGGSWGLGLTVWYRGKHLHRVWRSKTQSILEATRKLGHILPWRTDALDVSL